MILSKLKDKICFHCKRIINPHKEEYFEDRDIHTGRLKMRLCQSCVEVMMFHTFGVDVSSCNHKYSEAVPKEECQGWH